MLIDAFNDDINLTPSDPLGQFSPHKYNMSTMDTVNHEKFSGREINPSLIPVPQEGMLNTILLVPETAGPSSSEGK